MCCSIKSWSLNQDGKSASSVCCVEGNHVKGSDVFGPVLLIPHNYCVINQWGRHHIDL